MKPIKKLSDIKIADNRKATLQFLNNRLKHRKPEFPAPAFFLLLGAGCSVDAQIPSGGGIISFLQKRFYAQNHLSYKSETELEIDKIDKLFENDIVKKEFKAFIEEKHKICHANVDEQKKLLIDSLPIEIKDTLVKENPKKNLWDIVKEEFYNTSYYSFWFDTTLPSPRDRQQLIEKVIDKKEPSAAYFLLACAVKKDIFRTFFTTNFDDLINDAILQETGIKSRVYVHNEVVKFINFSSPRPNIIKLHGDYLYQDMKNTMLETSDLQNDQFIKLQEAAVDMGAIIIGYSGADLSIMNALYKIKEEKGADFPLFWCAKNEDSMSWRAKYLINKYENSYFIPTDSFDQLTHSIYLDLDCKIRDIKEKTEVVENNHKKAIDLIARLNKSIIVPSYLEPKKEKLEDDLSIDDIITNARNKEKLEDRINYLTLGIQKYPDNVSLLMWRSKYNADAKCFIESITDCDSVILIDSHNASAFSNRGFIKRILKLYEDAIIDFNKAIEIKPNFLHAYNNRGLAMIDLKKYQEAILDFNIALEIDTTNADAYNNRGLAMMHLKKYEEAIVDLIKSIEIDNTKSSPHNNIGLTKIYLKQYKEAIIDLDRAIELDNTKSNAYNNRGLARIYLKQYAEAIIDLDRAIELDSTNTNAYNNRGLVRIYLKQYTEALIDIDRAIELDNTNSFAYNNRGFAMMHLKKYEEAIIHFNEAIKHDLIFAVSYKNKGVALLLLGNYDEAETNLLHAIEINKDYTKAYSSIAVLYAIKGDVEKFYANFELAFQKDFNLSEHDMGIYEMCKQFFEQERFKELQKKYNIKLSD